ncbi:MAG: MlaD family protein [Burkholderiaceae bacterium]|nr:MlaD family protein [Sulfuritalea sp.]MCF8174911.1 MlaD family protein [Burkholderiaceae bacterium]
MSRKANPTLIGAFVVGAAALAVATTLLLAGGNWFGERRQHVLYFAGAAQGLQVGAPVVFLGVKVGTVKQIQLGLDPHSRRFVVPVMIELEPQAVRASGGEPIDLRDRATVQQLVERGLRARLRMQSLLTGQLYVDLDFHPDKPAVFAALDPDLSEIPTIRTTVQELATKLEGFPMDSFLTDVAAISSAVNKLMSARTTQELPQRLEATLRHLESLAARFDAQGGPILNDVRANLAELNKALLAAQAAMVKLDTAADRVAGLAQPDSRMVEGMSQASEELAKAAAAVRHLTEQESPAMTNVNAALKEITRAANALRLLAETLDEQPEAILRGKRKKDPS